MTDNTVKLADPAKWVWDAIQDPREQAVGIAEAMRAYATAAVMAERERCARVCEAIAPSGGRAWTESQHAAAVALGIAANAIRQSPAEDGE